MSKQPTIVVTGAAGFIGSVFVQYLNEQGLDQLLLVDDFGVEEKRKNWEAKKYLKVIERQAFITQLENDEFEIEDLKDVANAREIKEGKFAVEFV